MATITPSAAYVVKNVPLMSTSRRASRPVCTFSSTASLSANQRPCAEPGRLDRDLEHHALGDLVVAGDQAVERGVEVRRLDLGEVAHLADVHAEHRHARPRRRGRRPAAWCRHRRARSRRRGRSVSRSVPTRRSGGHAHLDAVRGEPRRRAARPARRRCRGSGCGHEADATDRARSRSRPAGTASSRRSSSSAGPRASQRTRNSTLPSAPRNGDDHHVDDVEAGVAQAVAHLVEHRAVHRRGRARSRPCRPGRGPPRTAASPAARGRRRACVQRASAGATVTSEMNERSATVRSTGAAEVVGLEVADVGALAHGDARVVAQRPGELAAADVDRVDVRGAGLEQAVGEPAGRRAGVEGPTARARRPRSARARRRASRRRGTRSGAGRRSSWIGSSAPTSRAGAGAGLPADPDPSGGDRLDRLAAAPEQPPAHELGVESPAHSHRRRIRGSTEPCALPRNAAIERRCEAAPRSAPTNGGAGSGIASPPGRRDRGGDAREHERERPAERGRRARRRSTAGRPPPPRWSPKRSRISPTVGASGLPATSGVAAGRGRDRGHQRAGAGDQPAGHRDRWRRGWWRRSGRRPRTAREARSRAS